MSRATALVVVVAVSLAASRAGHLCGFRGIDRHEAVTCDHARGYSDGAMSVAGHWETADFGAARQSIPACAEGDSREHRIRLESGLRVRRAIEEGVLGDAGVAIAPSTYRLSLRMYTYAARRPVEPRVPLERRPLSTNLRL
jgi:hypothetical protein